ncbi:MAG: phosphomannomutase/phosphoglucomutase [Rhodospirillales bacterium]|jgi:phosphomannomutase|nr:phosphomannomutase/phosphoglucomutase [Rhodospirillales bacterium]
MTEGHTLDSTILRKYDIRGIVDETLSAADMRIIGRAFGSEVVRAGGKTIATGYDGRVSSPELVAALNEGLAACGLSVRCIGCGPTPMLYYASHKLATDAAAMITGSHNPANYNGIKMVLNGRSFFDSDIQGLGKTAAAGDFESGEGDIAEVSVAAPYIERLFEDMDFGRPLIVAWDPGNGSSGEVVRAVCDRLPGKHIVINEKIDGTFPAHHPDPTVEENLVQLKEIVAAQRCDLGIAFDGDGDRIGVIDERGRVLWGDQLLALYSAEVLADVPGAAIIADVKASQVLFDEVARLGGKPVMAPAGHSIIKAKMAETNSPLAGEMSGHIFFAHRYFGFDDAIYAALRFLSIAGRAGTSVGTMRDALPQMVNTPELRFECAESRKFSVIEEVKERLSRMDGISVSDIDGVRVQTEDGWWLVRASNTQGSLVARCESSSAAGLTRLKATLAEQLRASNVDVPDMD